MKNNLLFIYEKLFEFYGSQGWWPVIFEERKNFADTGGYHKDSVIFSQRTTDRFEISAGAVLTQNTNWNNVYKSLLDFKKYSITNPEIFLESGEESIKKIIRRTGYYNQKYLKLYNLVSFMHSNNYFETPFDISSEALLGLWGIGEETADSILLYAFNRKVFVIDAYTKRIASRLDSSLKFKKYNDFQKYYIENIPDDIEIYNQYHALIVKHCVEICRKKPCCDKCVLFSYCDKSI